MPAYALDSIIGNVPLIGSLLLGGRGQGLFAANYRITGSTTDPRVWLDPLSASLAAFCAGCFSPISVCARVQ